MIMNTINSLQRYANFHEGLLRLLQKNSTYYNLITSAFCKVFCLVCVLFFLLNNLNAVSYAQNATAFCPVDQGSYKADCYGTRYFPNGDKYVGNFWNNEPNGAGKYLWSNGAVYIGIFDNGRMSGRGVLTLPNGAEYRGEFIDNQLNGVGTSQLPDGSNYRGEFKNGYKNGRGALSYSSGAKYVGEFKDDVESGSGTLIFVNGEKYIGHFENGARNGVGRELFPNGEMHVGEYKNGSANGQGAYYYKGGAKFVGEFKDGLPNGYGMKSFPSGEQYSGDFKNDKYDGRGVYKYSNGSVYKGQFYNNMENGTGQLIFRDGSNYTGDFKNGSFHGHGTLIQKSGIKYDGEFKDGIDNGQGVREYPDGFTYVCQSFNGMKHGIGVLKSPKGERFIGIFSNDRIDGEGMLISSKGEIELIGLWKKGVFSKSLVHSSDLEQYAIEQGLKIVHEPKTKLANLSLPTLSLAGVQLGDSLDEAIKKVGGQYLGLKSAKSLHYQSWILDDGNRLSVTSDKENNMVEYIELDWSGQDGPGKTSDFPGFIYGRTTREDINNFFASEGYEFSHRSWIATDDSGIIFRNTYNVGHHIITFYTKPTTQYIKLISRTKKPPLCNSCLVLDAISIASTSYAKIWGKPSGDTSDMEAQK